MPESKDLNGFDFSNYLAKGGTPEKAAEFLGVSTGDIANYLATKSDYNISAARQKGLHDEDIINFLAGPKGLQPVTQSFPQATKKALGIEINPTTIARTVMSGVAGAGAGYITDSPAVGSATMSAVDQVLKYATGQDEYKNLTDFGIKTSIGFLENEIGGRVLAAPFKFANAIDSLANASLANPITHPYIKQDILDLSTLSPTVAQYLKAQGSKWAGIASGFENLFASTNKVQSLENSFDAAKDAGDKFLEELSGRKGVTLGQSDRLTKMIKDGAEGQFLQMKLESNARGDLVKLIAENNSQIISNGTPTGKQIYGPVDYSSTLQILQNIKSNLYKANLKPDPDDKVLKVINEILDGVNAKFDPKTGALQSYEPVDFAKAWKDKQIANEAGWGSPLSNVNAVDPKFKQVAAAIDDDIERSIQTWKNGGQQAGQLYDEAKLIVAKRNYFYNGEQSYGRTLQDVIDKNSGTKQAVYAILDDPEKLKRYLETGSVVIPDSTKSFQGNSVNIKILSTNARADAQAATFQRALNGAIVPSTMDQTKNTIDPAKLMSFINDPEKQDSLEQIFGNNLSNVKQLFKNYSYTSEKGSGVSGSIGASRYLGLKFGTYGVALGSGIAAALTSGHLGVGSGVQGAIGVGVTLGAMELAKLMTDKNSARIMINMAQGAPLGMSTQLATRMIANVIRNRPVTISYSDGTQEQGKINSEGKFTIPLDTDINSVLNSMKGNSK